MDYQTNDYQTNPNRRNPFTHRAHTAPAPLKLIPYAELPAAPPPPQPLIEGFLSQPGLYLLLGHYLSKMTRTCLDLALSIALGRPWLGRTTHQSPVFWLDGESSPRHFFPRLAAVGLAYRLPKNIPFQIAFLGGSSLNSPSLLDTITHFVQEHQPGLVVIDPISWAFRSSIHLSPPDLIPLLHNLSHLIRELDITILLTHHTHDFDDYKNYPPLTNLLDRLFLLRSFPETPYIDLESPPTHTQPSLHLTAQYRRAHFPHRPWKSSRYFDKRANPAPPHAPEYDSQLHTAPLQAARLAVRARVPLNPADNHILNYLKAHGPSTTKKLISPPILSTEKQASNTIRKLKRLGLIHRVDNGNAGQTATYDLIHEIHTK